MNPLTQSKSTRLLLVLIALALTFACFALSPTARATCQEGCLTNGNTVLGDDALFNNTTGNDNTAVGFQALFNNTTGYNTAIGFKALFSNTTGNGNMASGDYALYSNTTGTNNTASGDSALYSNTTGGNNTASGTAALFSNTTASGNTATGDSALLNNTTGNGNTATGEEALLNNTTGNDNTANGANALYSNTTGNRNVADGIAALMNNTTGSGNIALGEGAGGNLTIGDHNIDIGNRGVEAEANTIRIGRVGTQTATFIAGISGATVPTGVAVIVDSSGHLGTTSCSARFKENIQPMDKASEAILALKPVTFRYKHQLDPDGIPQFGLVAEQVEKVNPDLVARDGQGKPYTVRYDAVNAMLLNEFLKEHRQVQAQEATITQLKSTVAQQQRDFQSTAAQQREEIQALTSQIQKVSDQLEVGKPAAQLVINNR